MIANLTACGGGSSSVISEETSSTRIYVDNDTLEPVTYPTLPTSTIAGTLDQQTVTHANDVWNLGYEGSNITIAVVDSGVNPNHIDFYDEDGTTRINWNDARGFESSDGYNIIESNDYRDIDSDFHGTHVSSIAVGREYGLAPKSTLLPINVVQNNTEVYNTVIYEGVKYAASRSPIINVSFSNMVNLDITNGSASELNEYVSILRDNDTVMIVAAGNEIRDLNNNQQYDDGYAVGAEHFNDSTIENLAIQSGVEDKVLSVIAWDSDNNSRAGFSMYPGSCADVTSSCDANIMTKIQNTFITAPGLYITAADGSSETQSIEYSGTSMAAPVVSGAIALLMSSWEQLTPQQAVQLLKETANNTFNGYTAREYGVGLLDIAAAFNPNGTLKSTTSNTSNNAFFLGQSVAKIPSALDGLAKLPALKKVAYFDRFNRDYLIDLSPSIHIEKTPISWNSFWNNAQPGLSTQTNLKSLTVTADFDSTKDIKKLFIHNKNSAFQYSKTSANGFMQSQFSPLTQYFYSNNLHDFGKSFSIRQTITPELTFFSSMQQQEESTTAKTNPIDSIANVQTVGLNYSLNDKLALNLMFQIREEQGTLMGMKGTGALSFGENNVSHINTLSLSYNHLGTQVFSAFQSGLLLQSKYANGSYINLNSAEIGQVKLGLMKEINSTRAWGIQAFNYNKLLDSNLTMILPSGFSVNDGLQNQTINYQQKNWLQLDSLELFYNVKTSKQSQLQFHAISNPDDSGLGINLHKKF